MRYVYYFGSSYNSVEGPPKNFKPFTVFIDTLKFGFIFTKETNEKIIELNPLKEAEINELIVIYNKWFDVFPFDMVVFSAVKDTFENKLPLKYNKEKVELFTPIELIELLKKISNLFFEQINASTIFHGNVIKDVNDHKVNLILEKRRLKSKLGYPASQNEFSDIVSEWLKDEQDAWEELTPILESSSNEKSDSPEKEGEKNSITIVHEEELNLKSKKQILNSIERKKIMDLIKAGRKDATAFHEDVYDNLKHILASRISNPKIELAINEGRKRLDIAFNNSDKEGFFYNLSTKHRVKCPKIIVECKNYGKEIGNPEVDQMNGRLNDRRGRFGIIVCRSIDNQKRLISRCKDLMHDNGNYIIVLEDKDILQLLEFRENNDEKSIDDFFESKIEELIM